MIKIAKDYLFKYKYYLFLYVVIALAMNALNLILPYFSGQFIDKLIEQNNYNILYKYIGIILLINLLNIIIGWINRKVYVHIQMNAGYQLNKDLLEHLKKTSLKQLLKQDHVYLSRQINNDANEVIIFLLTFIPDVIINLINIIGIAVLLFLINKYILIIFVTLAVIDIILVELFKGKVYTMQKKTSEHQALFFSHLNQHLSNIKFIRANATNSYFVEKTDKQFNSTYSQILNAQRIQYQFASIERIISICAQCSIFFLGGKSVLEGKMTIGVLSIIMTYFVIYLNAFKYFINLRKDYYSIKVSQDRIENWFGITYIADGNKTLNQVKSIELKNIAFGYVEHKFIKEFNYRFEHSYIYTICGSNGVGKSTLVDLILGLYPEEYTGEIFYNEHSISRLEMTQIRKEKIGVMQQNPDIVGACIFDYLNMSHTKIDIQKVEELLMYFDMENMMERIYSIDDVNLSGGEKQRIDLIRILLKNPDVLILDEPTSAMDEKSVMQLGELLIRLKDTKIIILITHDPRIVKYGDVVINL